MADRKTVIKALEYCILKETSCRGCPYEEKECTRTLKSDVLSLLKEQEGQIKNRDESLEKAREEIKWLRGMLKEQEAVVRCKDCIYYRDDYRCKRIKSLDDYRKPDWFCADGERKEGR